MDNLQIIDSYFNSQSIQFDVITFITDLGLVTLLSLILGLVYLNFGTTISSRKSFVGIFPLLALTTMLIISVIKSSLALSLGLVGALSIVRFRAAIKEPEELAYLFLTISLGLGFGASQKYITTIAFLFIIVILIIRGLFVRKRIDQNLFLSVNSSENLDLEGIVDTIKNNISYLSLKRFDNGDDGSEIIFQVKLKNINSISNIQKDLKKVSNKITISFIEDKGIFNW